MSAIAATLDLPRSGPSVLAVGAFLKNTICVTKGAEAHLSAVHGDLGTPEAIAAFEAAAAAMVAELGVTPIGVAHDLHPDFHCTRYALGLDLPALGVQHHHAHAAAIAVEHGHDGPLIGISLDGFGLGPDHDSWGGELLAVDGPAYRRLGHFAALPQPGGDTAAREPWRMASAVLHQLGRADEIAGRFAAIPAAARLSQILAKGINCPPTSSAGRLFDAACGLLGIHLVAEFEGQAPMALEKLATALKVMDGGWRMENGILDFHPLLSRLSACTDTAEGANLFHGTLVAALADWAAWAAEETGWRSVALGGGCFLNRVLTTGLVEALTARGLKALTARALSPGDAGLAVGQAWIAAQHWSKQ